jgi:hypothetical protein
MNSTDIKEKRGQLESLQYDILLKKKGSTYFMIIPELAIVSKGEILDAVHEDIMRRKSDYFSDLMNCGMEEDIVYPEKIKQNTERAAQMKIFIYKLLVVCVLLFISVVSAVATVSNKIAALSGSALGGAAVRSILSELDAISKLPEDMKKDRIKRLREITTGVKPFADELKPLIYPDRCQERENTIREKGVVDSSQKGAQKGAAQ